MAKIILPTPNPINFEVHSWPVSSTTYLAAYQKQSPIGIANIKFDISFKLIFLILLRTTFALFLAYSVTVILDLDGVLQKIILLQAVLPAALFNFLFSSEYSISPPEVANYIMLSTIISILTISIFLFIII